MIRKMISFSGERKNDMTVKLVIMGVLMFVRGVVSVIYDRNRKHTRLSNNLIVTEVLCLMLSGLLLISIIDLTFLQVSGVITILLILTTLGTKITEYFY